MNKSFSIYLDLVRFTAACLVYIYHSNQRWLVHDILPVSNFGHSSVIVFFVLSGFVIAYITDTKEKTFVAYASSRISRIYSVALPSVLLTIALDTFGRQIDPTTYTGNYPFDDFFLRGAASLLLLNEVWFVSITSFSNVPYWSICYEMWYYVAFGIVMFLPKRIGVLVLFVLALVLGPKIVLLAPIWILGVILYRWKRLRTLPESLAWLLLVVSCVGLFVFHYVNATELGVYFFRNIIGEKWHAQLTFSKFFPTDYLLGILIFLNFAGMHRLSHRIAPLMLKIERPIRFLASYTLSLYLLHQPLLLFWGTVIEGSPIGYIFWCKTTVMVTVSVFSIGYITESKRYLLRMWLEPHLRRLETMVHHHASHH
jgi:peptidoglycan/LPS O-acetylase OafA/YrhL